MEIHHGKHHRAYVDKLNAALAGMDGGRKPIEEVIASLSSVPDDKRTAVRNNGGGHANHCLFWNSMAPRAGGSPLGKLAEALDAAFGSFEKFQEEFTAVALKCFGSGWAWLCKKDDSLLVCSTANQDSPLMGEDVVGCTGAPLLCIDVWEHAYYLKYQNRRSDYVKAFWSVVNWKEVSRRYEQIP
jgi:Fe-Mn family superoxide dismutase